MVRGVKKLKETADPTTTFFCLSNANSVFISTILKVTRVIIFSHHVNETRTKSKGLENLFEEIVTNPAEWESSGLLNLRRRVDPNGPQHSCKVGCSSNMCKGMFSVLY